MQQPENTHLAQLNISTAVDDLDSPTLAGFMAALDGVNAVADRSEGFVWRLQDEAGNATSISACNNPRVVVNMSVWETPEHLEQFVWNTIHKRVYGKRTAWFRPVEQANFVMWWVPAGHVPTVDEAFERLTSLRENGASERAFGWDALPNVTLWRQQSCA